MHVVSTGWRHATAGLCRASVASQLDVEAVHHYVEASEQDPPRTKVENLREIIGTLPTDAVVACLDGDDWLSHKRALARVAQAHAEGAWVTWGSFRNSDGSPGFAAPYEDHESYRQTPWRATHLKTFRAGLFQRIREADLKYPAAADGKCVPLVELAADMRWIDRGDDPAFMWPILEMAGRDRCKYIRDFLYVYNEAEGWHRTASEAALKHQADIVELTRARKPYERLEAL